MVVGKVSKTSKLCWSMDDVVGLRQYPNGLWSLSCLFRTLFLGSGSVCSASRQVRQLRSQMYPPYHQPFHSYPTETPTETPRCPGTPSGPLRFPAAVTLQRSIHLIPVQVFILHSKDLWLQPFWDLVVAWFLFIPHSKGLHQHQPLQGLGVNLQLQFSLSHHCSATGTRPKVTVFTVSPDFATHRRVGQMGCNIQFKHGLYHCVIDGTYFRGEQRQDCAGASLDHV